MRCVLARAISALVTLSTLLLVLVLPTAPAAAAPPVVHAVLFWLDTCPHCHYVIDEVLPPLEARYGAQLDIRRIEVSSEANGALLARAASTLGYPDEQVGVPFLVIGERALVGANQIPAELPGLIEQHLANGGVAFPAIPGLAEALAPAAGAVPEGQAAAAPASQERTRPAGFGLAIAVILGMLAALGITAVRVLRRTPAKQPAARLRWLVPVLALAGLGVALYLAMVELTATAAVCGPVGDCNAVQQSPYARLFGVVPIALLGVATYLILLGAWFWAQRQPTGRLAPLLIFGLTLAGTLFSLYLTVLEPFVIGAVCLWCLSSAVLTTLLLLLSTGPALQALHPAGVMRGRQGHAPARSGR